MGLLRQFFADEVDLPVFLLFAFFPVMLREEYEDRSDCFRNQAVRMRLGSRAGNNKPIPLHSADPLGGSLHEEVWDGREASVSEADPEGQGLFFGNFIEMHIPPSFAFGVFVEHVRMNAVRSGLITTPADSAWYEHLRHHNDDMKSHGVDLRECCQATENAHDGFASYRFRKEFRPVCNYIHKVCLFFSKTHCRKSARYQMRYRNRRLFKYQTTL
ncbi:MAG: hypothetical protein JWN37_634 [Candidatus Nomurabacteria bacterium]|nr:hypothetical protein [Candidatus Nomurabacteria bacterium]